MCCRHCSLRADTKTWLALLGRAHGQKQMRSSAVAGRQLDARLGLQEEIFQDAVIYFPLTDLCRDKEGLWVEKPGTSERTIYTTSSSFAPPHHPLLPLLSNLHMLLSPSSSSHPSQLQLLSSPKRLILISSVQFVLQSSPPSSPLSPPLRLPLLGVNLSFPAICNDPRRCF